MVKGAAECPCEVKLVTHASPGGNDGGVRANIDAFAGLARCLSKIAEDIEAKRLSDTTRTSTAESEKPIQEFLCTYVNRVKAVYIAKLGFDFAKSKIVSVVVGPKFHTSRNYDGVLLCPLADFTKWSFLHQALPPSYTPGFLNLVRLVDELRILKQLLPIKLMLNYDSPVDQERELSEDLEILHQGSKSVVFHEEGSTHCIKIGFTESIKTEWKAHRILDAENEKESRLRRGLATGVVRGAGDGLRFIEFAGLGSPFRETLRPMAIVDREIYWQQACNGLQEIHKKDYFHGDIKPENMLIIDSKLVINDFDSCCGKNAVWTKR